jgi:hypothetical protein
MAETNRHRRHDRHARLGAKLTAETREAVTDKFIGQRVLLTGDARRTGTVFGRLMIRVAANLIARFCPKIDVALPQELSGLQSEIIEMLRKIDSSPDAEFRSLRAPAEHDYAATLSIGTAPEGLPDSIVIDDEGWLAILGKRSSLSETSVGHDGNPFGALMASALGAAEVFKHLLKPLPGKAFHFGDVTFSTFY